MSLLRYFWEELKDVWKKGLIRIILVLFIAFILFEIIRWKALPEFWYTIPLAMVSVVLTAFLFEAPGFRSFLQQTALEVIQDKKYLETLKRDNLEKMLKKIHQVYYRLPDELEKGNLYDFVKENILYYLDKAYEDNVEIEYDLYKKNDYVEMNVNKKFRITASSEKPVEGDRDILLLLTPIPGKDEEFHFPFDKYLLKVNGEETGFPPDSKKVTKDGDALKFSHKLKYQVSRSSPMSIDYKIGGNEGENGRLVHQMFPLPTKGFRLRVTAHDFGDCVFEYEFSGSIKPIPEKVKKDRRKFDISYDGWMIPSNSITVHFKPI
jgi:hypothetical protein